MNDRRRDEANEGNEGQGRGPQGTEWLELELSKVLDGIAERHVKAAAEEIIKDALKARLRERIGPQLEAIAHRAADQLADDIAANLDIEARIQARIQARREPR